MKNRVFAAANFSSIDLIQFTVSTWPVVNAGTNLGVNVVGVLDYAGTSRVNANGQINIGAYEQ